MFLNVEIKARCEDPTHVRTYLIEHNARYVGKDFQRDTYFITPKGRLKLREGLIENALIYYERKNQEGPKESSVILYHPSDIIKLKSILENTMDVRVQVFKNREIYFLANVKFHIDIVENLGNFIEIEAIDDSGTNDKKKLQEQCEFYLDKFAIRKKDLISESYSDMLLT
ncbi:MAG: adenylate cyclase [Bacteroidetes bacterium]|nr:MAG: adenylate cyclase [Bacteroidota bacterium]